jgi:hypothetical protein
MVCASFFNSPGHEENFSVNLIRMKALFAKDDSGGGRKDPRHEADAGLPESSLNRSPNGRQPARKISEKGPLTRYYGG